MAWFGGKVSLGYFPDLAGAVNKISESVKTIEKNFDTALGFEEKSDSSASEGGESPMESIEKAESLKPPSSVEENEEDAVDRTTSSSIEQTRPDEAVNDRSAHVPADTAEVTQSAIAEGTNATLVDPSKSESDSLLVPVELSESNVEHVEEPAPLNYLNEEKSSAVGLFENSKLVEAKLGTDKVDLVEGSAVVPRESQDVIKLHETTNEQNEQEVIVENVPSVRAEDAVSVSQAVTETGLPGSISAVSKETESTEEQITDDFPAVQSLDKASETVSELVSHENDTSFRAVDLNQQAIEYEPDNKDQLSSSGSSAPDIEDSVVELERLKKEMKMMETALQEAARQAQAKADEIAKLMNENEHLKAVTEDFRRKSSEAEIESIREEYHQRFATLERKVYALTKERDTLRREQSKKRDASTLLKEKDEIINQVMAEGEELSKKQATQESQIRKLRVHVKHY